MARVIYLGFTPKDDPIYRSGGVVGWISLPKPPAPPQEGQVEEGLPKAREGHQNHEAEGGDEPHGGRQLLRRKRRRDVRSSRRGGNEDRRLREGREPPLHVRVAAHPMETLTLSADGFSYAPAGFSRTAAPPPPT
jgi:hypothetical protein